MYYYYNYYSKPEKAPHNLCLWKSVAHTCPKFVALSRNSSEIMDLRNCRSSPHSTYQRQDYQLSTPEYFTNAILFTHTSGSLLLFLVNSLNLIARCINMPNIYFSLVQTIYFYGCVTFEPLPHKEAKAKWHFRVNYCLFSSNESRPQLFTYITASKCRRY